MDILTLMVQALQDTGEFNKVEQAIELSVLSPNSLTGNAQCWVLELATDPGKNLTIGRPTHNEIQLYGVLIGIKALNDYLGQKTIPKLRDKRQAVRQAIFGLNPQGYTPFELGGSNQVQFAPGAVFWIERFKTTTLINRQKLL